MTNSFPCVSVVMTVWNGEKYIAETIESVLSQTFQDWELVIIDDGSTDGTCAVIESFQDARIRLIKRPHLGVVPSANFGVSQAQGKYIARLDADDISLPERLLLQVRELDKNPRAVLCYTNVTVFGENIFGDVSPTAKKAWFARDTALVLIKMCFNCPFTHSSVMFRREAFDKIGGYLAKHPAEDYSLYTRLARVGVFVGVPLKLVKYRRHAGSATSRRMDELHKYAHEIRVDHIEHFLKVDGTRAEKFDQLLQMPSGGRPWRGWLSFFFQVLHRAACWRPEPLGWMLMQTIRMGIGRFR